jgi:hypothetical protein
VIWNLHKREVPSEGKWSQLAPKSTRLEYFGGERRRNEMKKGAEPRKSADGMK